MSKSRRYLESFIPRWKGNRGRTVFIVLDHKSIGTLVAVSGGKIGEQLKNAIVLVASLNIKKQTPLYAVGIERSLSKKLLHVRVDEARHFPPREST